MDHTGGWIDKVHAPRNALERLLSLQFVLGDVGPRRELISFLRGFLLYMKNTSQQANLFQKKARRKS